MLVNSDSGYSLPGKPNEPEGERGRGDTGSPIAVRQSSGMQAGRLKYWGNSALKYPITLGPNFEPGYIAQHFGPTENQANLKQALEFTIKAAERDPNDWRIIDNLGMYYFMLGGVDLRRACSMPPRV